MTPTTPERWLPVVGYEGYYEVSDLGNVRSVDRSFTDAIGRIRNLKGRPIKAHINGGNGRRMLPLSVPGRRKRLATIYPLVLEAFVGPRPSGMEACHNDGDCTDDRLSNLRWDTASANRFDTVQHGRHYSANKTACPYGHELADPNLVPSALPARVCLACSRARGCAPSDHQSLSDWHYGRIKQGA